MNQPFGRLLLGGLCCLIALPAAQAQQYRPDWVIGPDGRAYIPSQPPLTPRVDNASLPSHRPIDSGVGDLSQAEDLLAHRLHRTHNLQDLQNLLKPFQDHPELLKQFKNIKPEDLRKLEDVVKNNPSLLDDPKLGDLLTQVEKLQHGETLDDDKRKNLEDLAKDLFDKHKKELPTPLHPGDTGEAAAGLGASADTVPPAPSIGAGPAALRRPLPGRTGSTTTFSPAWPTSSRTSTGPPRARRCATPPARPRQIGRRPFWGSSGFADFLKGVISSDEAAWLAHNLKPPSMPNVGGWSAGPTAVRRAVRSAIPAACWTAWSGSPPSLLLGVAAGWPLPWRAGRRPRHGPRTGRRGRGPFARPRCPRAKT